MNKGLFISFEGPDGSGKSTQIKKVFDYLKNKGFDVYTTREPGGTNISEKIRSIILDPENDKMDSMTEALLYAASRAQHTSEFIRPLLSEGKIVLCDRFMDSSIAYQGYARGLGDSVRIINEYAVDGTLPDITFFFDLAPKEALKRVNRRDSLDRLELEKIDFHNKVYEGYLQLAKIYKDRFIFIDASKSIDEVFNDLIEKLEDYFARAEK